MRRCAWWATLVLVAGLALAGIGWTAVYASGDSENTPDESAKPQDESDTGFLDYLKTLVADSLLRHDEDSKQPTFAPDPRVTRVNATPEFLARFPTILADPDPDAGYAMPRVVPDPRFFSKMPQIQGPKENSVKIVTIAKPDDVRRVIVQEKPPLDAPQPVLPEE